MRIQTPFPVFSKNMPVVAKVVAKVVALAVTMASLNGCASVSIEQTLARSNQDAAGFTQGKLQIARSDEQRQAMRAQAEALLQKPLAQHDAVALALANSPAVQALIAQHWANAAAAAQTGRIANPVLTIERLTIASELEIARLLSFGLLDVVTLPSRSSAAQQRIVLAQLRLTSEAIEHITDIRQAWVRAVAAEQTLAYAKQVSGIAEASAELARRMQKVGNFNKLQRARQQAFYADAATQFALSSHAATATREGLVRLLGLTEEQAGLLKIPDRLPELPSAPRDPQEVASLASQERLDVTMAKRSLDALAIAQGLNLIASFTDIELAVRRDTIFDNSTGTNNSRRGFEVTASLPVFDWGGMKREAMGAQLLAAVNHLEATVRAVGPNLRESYSSYRTSYDIAKHYRDEIVPLRKVIAEENVLRYNGMIIGVFELLADARDQVSSVIAAINAQRQFWLSDAALQASIIGKPTMMPLAPMVPGMTAGSAPH
jgi:outer membrane protein TolC